MARDNSTSRDGKQRRGGTRRRDEEEDNLRDRSMRPSSRSRTEKNSRRAERHHRSERSRRGGNYRGGTRGRDSRSRRGDTRPRRSRGRGRARVVDVGTNYSRSRSRSPRSVSSSRSRSRNFKNQIPAFIQTGGVPLPVTRMIKPKLPVPPEQQQLLGGQTNGQLVAATGKAGSAPLSAEQLREQISRNLDGIILNTLEQKSADGKNSKVAANPAPRAGPRQFPSSNGAAVTGQSGTSSAQAVTGTAVLASSGAGEHNDDDPLDAFMGNLGKELQEKNITIPGNITHTREVFGQNAFQKLRPQGTAKHLDPDSLLERGL
ncbi:unnamed protein product [Amoebophrya sp. A120]|nr:unnamed protein product [Amoebophrya sp. A120]|eukprot:GSA120T00017145001.1